MIYEIRIYNLTVGGVPEFEKNFGAVVEQRAKLSRLMGFFHSDIGDLNRVMHIWEYESLEHRAKVRAETMRQPWWPPKGNEAIIQKQISKIAACPPFRPEPRTGALGNVYEFRTYTVIPGKMHEVLSRWTQHLGPREELSPLAACFTTDMGPLNEFIHVWPYRDVNHRNEIRLASRKLAHWPPGSAPFLMHQNTEIWLPASFSPMH